MFGRTVNFRKLLMLFFPCLCCLDALRSDGLNNMGGGSDSCKLLQGSCIKKYDMKPGKCQRM